MPTAKLSVSSVPSPSHFINLPEWLTPAEVQAFLRLSRSSLYQRLRSGDIPSRKFGRQYRVAKAALKPEVAP
jgi:excisionase family DNA binding protein